MHTNKIMVASGQRGYRAVLVNADHHVIQTAPTAHSHRIRAQLEAAIWANRARLPFDDSVILPRDLITATQFQVGQCRSVRAYLGA